MQIGSCLFRSWKSISVALDNLISNPLPLVKLLPKGNGFLFLLSYSLKRYHLALVLLRRGGLLGFWLGRGRFHEAANLLRRASLHIVGDVRIGVQGESGAEVAQHAGQSLHIHAAGGLQMCDANLQTVYDPARLLGYLAVQPTTI